MIFGIGVKSGLPLLIGGALVVGFALVVRVKKQQDEAGGGTNPWLANV